MQPNWPVLRAAVDCHYKAWLLNKEQTPIELPVTLSIDRITPQDKTALIALYIEEQSPKQVFIKLSSNSEPVAIKLKPSKKAEKLLAETKKIITGNEPPPFYKNKHCPLCQFRESCYKKLQERDCISLLGNISPKILAKYHKKGIFTITQLSHLFRPRRRSRRKPKIAPNYMWELKALAIREKKTFIMYTPEVNEIQNAIYIDFEGIPEEAFIYLIGITIKQEGKLDEHFSLWADDKKGEKKIFLDLFEQLKHYRDYKIYHYGSYESKALRAIAKKYGTVFKQEHVAIEGRLINLLSYLRTYVYPPIYSNGLKELAGFIGYRWTGQDVDGLKSIEWRKQWENTSDDVYKNKLLEYNHEDCAALNIVNKWFQYLATNGQSEGVQQVSEMKKPSPYKFHDNPDYGEDYTIISRAAYFDYQRNKIYWRNKKVPRPAATSREHQVEKHPGKGMIAWQPRRVNEVIIAPPLKNCPYCGSTKIYQVKSQTTIKRQTDIKFTRFGIKQHVTEYRSHRAKCAKCTKNFNNKNLRMLHYGDNLFAWVINIYVSYHISHYMISKMLMEQFGIWMNPMYLIQRKYKWWRRWQPEVDYLWQIIRNSPVIHIDETSVKLSRDKGYVWVFATPHTVFYHFTLNREAEFLKEWLKDYEGVIVTDSFPGYEILPIKRQECLVHLIRDLNDELYKSPFDDEYKSMVTAFSKLLRAIIETIDKHGLRKKHFEKHVKATEEFFQEYLLPEHASELSVKYAKRLKKHWDNMWMFLQYDDVPWNNNNAETAIKAFAQHRRGVNGQVSERGLREYLEMLSLAQTCRYRNISYLDFLRRKAGLWENIPSESLSDFMPFNQARQFIQRLGFERKNQWNIWKREGKRPFFIPSSPERVYRNSGWVSWHDWLGFNFMPFDKARTHMRKLGLKNRDEYWAWQRSGKRPKTIPASPEKVYKHTGWKDLGDWLGTGNLGQQSKKKVSYKEAKAFVQALGIKTQKEFFEWRKSSQRPETIPSAPERAYYEFEGWGKFLGTDRVANQNKRYWSYEKAKAYLKPLHIRSLKHYRELHNLGIISKYIPRSPFAYYKKAGTWISIPDFFERTKE